MVPGPTFIPKILCVEDDPDTLELITVFLESVGYSITPVGTSSEALTSARETRFDLYILDIGLSDKDGIRLCREIRAFDAITPVVFFSGYPDLKSAALAAGAQEFLPKLVDFDELAEKIAYWVRESRRMTGSNF